MNIELQSPSEGGPYQALGLVLSLFVQTQGLTQQVLCGLVYCFTVHRVVRLCGEGKRGVSATQGRDQHLN